MVSNKYPLIAREGWPWLAALAALFAAASYWWHPPTLLLVGGVLVLLLFVFRDPERRIPSAPLGVVSPVDGVVLAIQECQDPFLQREALCVEIRMNVRGVYSIRSPIEGKIIQQWQKDGEQIAYANSVETDEGDQIVWSGQRRIATSPQCYVHPGERVGHGQRCGYWLLGGNFHVYLPISTRVKVSVGDRLVGGEDILATLMHREAVSGIAK